MLGVGGAGNGLDFVCVFVGFIFVCVCFPFFVVLCVGLRTHGLSLSCFMSLSWLSSCLGRHVGETLWL